MTKKIITIIR